MLVPWPKREMRCQKGHHVSIAESDADRGLLKVLPKIGDPSTDFNILQSL